MRVLLQAGVDLSLPGGLETHLRELAAGLMARGHDVAIAARPERLPPFRMVREAESADFDVIHLHGGPVPPALAGLPRIVSTLHFCVAAKMAVYVRIGRLRTLANPGNWRAVAGERSLARRSPRLIAVSERVRQEFARWHAMDPARATVISNGWTPRAAALDRAELRRRYGIAESARVLLTIGRDDFVKGYDLLARAWQRSGARFEGAVWVTAGGRAPAREPGRVVTGPVPHAEVASWIAAADLGALPSWYEGCSVALLEMLGGGLFTLAHDVGNAAEVIRPGVNGAIVTQGAAGWSAALRLGLGRPEGRAPGLDDSFTWPAIVERTERVYEEVAGR